MMLSQIIAASCLVVVLSTFSVVVVDGTACALPSLPTDLDLITSVEATHHREVHLHGMYRIGADRFDPSVKGQVHNVTFDYAEPHELRVSMLPHDAASLDLLLYRAADNVMVECAMKGPRGVERLIAVVLEANVKYVLMIKYTLPWKRNGGGTTACPSVMMELAVQPRSLAPKFTDVCLQAQAPQLPQITPTSEQAFYFEYKTPAESPHWISQSASAAQSGNTMLNTDELKLVSSYPIRVPYIRGRQQRWKLLVKLQARFLDGGDLVMLVTPATVTTPPTLAECAARSSSSSDGTSSASGTSNAIACSFGTRAIRNHLILQSVLWSDVHGDVGSYTLWLLQRPSDNVRKSCAPVSFHITLFPMAETENFITCAADPLPVTFHWPGLYDNLTGTMSFSQSVLVNLTTRNQEVRFQPTVDGTSLLRVHLGDHDELDIDAVLLHRPVDTQSPFTTAAASTAVSGPEGIVYPVDNHHEYILRITVPYPFRQYSGSDHDFYHFCDTYPLTVNIFPPLSSTESQALASEVCDASPPIFYGIQDAINTSKRFEYGLPNLATYPFSYPVALTSKLRQGTIAAIPFYIPSEGLIVSAIVYSDAFAGTVQLQLFDDDDDSGEPLYSIPRAVGSSLIADLDEGWYTLKLLTPYMQTSSLTYAQLFGTKAGAYPTCIRFNMILRIQSKNSCLSALQLPAEYPTTKHMHRHVADTYEIPLDGHHYMSITPTRDSIFHILTSASDYPLKLYVFSGDSTSLTNYDDFSKNKNLITSGVSLLQSSKNTNQGGYVDGTRLEVVVMLRANRPYTIVFDFTTSNEWDGAFYCSTFDVQMSLSKTLSLSTSDANSCNVHPDLSEETELGTLPSDHPFAFGPLAVALHPKGKTASRATALMHQWMTSFTVEKTSLIRVNLEFEFSHHSLGMLLCRVATDSNSGSSSSSDAVSPSTTGSGESSGDLADGSASASAAPNCVDAAGYYNGLEIASTTLSPGSYMLVVVPWHGGVKSGNPADDVQVNFCTYATLQMLVSASDLSVKAAKESAAPLCPAMLQYLPSSLNNVAFLSPFYNDEMHFFLNALVSQQHMEDRITFKLGEPSIIRASSPSPIATVSFAIAGDEDSVVFGREAALYAKLPAGDYQLRLHYFIAKQDFASLGSCPHIPIEVSIMTTEDITAVSADVSRCTSSLSFPTVPFFHGHDTLFRDPSVPFSKTIDFTIGSRGGSFECDVRYNFETSGLLVKFWGEIAESNGQTTQKRFLFTYFSDRAYLSLPSLLPGTYHLQLVDPANDGKLPNAYTTASTYAPCIPYSIHMRSSGVVTDNNKDGTPVPPPAGSPTTLAPPAKPELDCSVLRVDPFPTSFFAHSYDTTFAFSSGALQIPFSAGSRITINVGQHQVPMTVTRRVINVRASVQQVLRLWMRTNARVFSEIRLFDGSRASTDNNDDGEIVSDGNDAVAKSHSFGYHTQSLYFPVRQMQESSVSTSSASRRTGASSRDIRVEIVFYYRSPPEYHTDYENCADKQRLTTFELYAALFSEDDTRLGTTCNDTIASMSAVDRLPPAVVQLSSKRQVVASRYTLTQDEATLNQPGHVKPRSKTSHIAVDTMAAGDVPGVSIELRDVIHTALNTTIVIPQGAEGSRLIAHVKYPLNVMNMRLALYGANQSAALVEGFGAPLLSSDGTFQGQALLMVPVAKTLLPGVYYLMTLVSNVLPLRRKQIYCMPIDWRLDLSAMQVPSGRGSGSTPLSPAPTIRKRPSLVDVIPRSMQGLDRSDALSITFVLSEDAAMAVDPSSNFAMLQRVDNGALVPPSSQYYTDTNVFTVVFAGSTLEWGTVYRLTLDGSRMQTAGTGETFDVSAFDASGSTELLYATATCGCLGGFCVPGGGCQCTEPNGERCSQCPSGFQLSLHTVEIGVGNLQTRRRICEPVQLTTPAPRRRVTPAPAHPLPTGSPPQTPQPQSPPAQETPAPMDRTDATSVPSEGGSDVGAHPPLRTLRYALGYGALALLVLYTVMFLMRYRGLVRRNLASRNPFRVIGTSVNDAADEAHNRGEAGHMMRGVRVFGSSSAAATLSDEEDEDEQ